uniref:hypothetical protein n=1 Tax=Streptomyces sp. NBC_00998 TaxID=2903712 RepID=UPI002F90AA00|nr:hypothetical protein OG513_38800 [Streptomyces sp. NBC_00998]
MTSQLAGRCSVAGDLGLKPMNWSVLTGEGWSPRRAILHIVNREDLAAALEQHATDAAYGTALALRSGAAFEVWAGSLQPACQYLDIYAWRAECMAQDGVSTCKDFGQGLPDLQRAGDGPVALGRVDTAEGTHVVFLAADLKSVVAVL